MKIGDKVTATQAIYEGPDDHSPGGYLCKNGDTLVIRGIYDRPGVRWPYSVSHEDVTDMSFSVSASEIAADQTKEGPA